MNFLIINNKIANFFLEISYFIKIKLIFLYNSNNIIKAKLINSNYYYFKFFIFFKDILLIFFI